ncbi:MAG TPA: type IV secretory system conjugative DNA transfer family protein [Clostridia bacterium]|nr:type IV secretory system conjugative DNA transfer family protein [Clostridia bacterium]
MIPKKQTGATVFLVLFVFIIWLAVIIAPCFEAEGDIFKKINALPSYLDHPLRLSWLPKTPHYIVGLSLSYWFAVLYWWAIKRKTRSGEEHGSARWGNVKDLNKKYANKEPEANVIYTKNFRMGLDDFKHQHNLHTLVVGGSGAGKSRGFCKPNLLQGNTSFIVTDPKGELLSSTGAYLQSKGYEIRVFDLIHPSSSMGYNPFVYIEEEKDILSLVTNFIRNTTPKNSMSNDPYWEQAATQLLNALMLLLWREADEGEQNFETIFDMLRVMSSNEEFSAMNPIDSTFEQLRQRDPDHVALKQYDLFSNAPAKTKNSVVSTLGVRLAYFGLPTFARMTARDEMDFRSIGLEKVALFCVIPDLDKSLNFLISMLYTQVFQQLKNLAVEQKNNRLPVPVHCIMDEFANIPVPDMFSNILGVGRGYRINISIILQSISQLKVLFDKEWEAIIDIFDQFLYLGGNNPATFEYISKLLDKETIDTNTYGHTRGRNGSFSTNYQRIGRALLTPDEVRRVPRQYAILFVANELAIIDKKYNLLKHPACKETADGRGTRFNYSNSLSRIYANGFRAQDYEIHDPNEEYLPLEPEDEPTPMTEPPMTAKKLRHGS